MQPIIPLGFCVLATALPQPLKIGSNIHIQGNPNLQWLGLSGLKGLSGLNNAGRLFGRANSVSDLAVVSVARDGESSDVNASPVGGIGTNMGI